MKASPTQATMNTCVIQNYSQVKPSLFYLPLLILTSIALLLYSHHSLQADKYVQLQKEAFYFINYHLGQFPRVLYNVTQIGDASIVFALLSIFLLYASKLWEALISASLVSLILSAVLKNIFSVPRPAVALDNNSFLIIGNKAVGFASLPSGHSITVFTTLAILLFAFMPQKMTSKVLWALLAVTVGLVISMTRVGVGAHYPLDVIVGSTVGYISGLIGIFISQKYKVWAWINNTRYYPIFLALMLAAGISLIIKIMDENLVIYYLALLSLIFPFYKMLYAFLKK